MTKSSPVYALNADVHVVSAVQLSDAQTQRALRHEPSQPRHAKQPKEAQGSRSNVGVYPGRGGDC